MADASLQIGNGNWGVKTSLLLGYNVVSNRYNPIEIGVTRETLGSRTNVAGIIDYKDNNIARINYASGVGSLLLEPQRTNLLLNSGDFQNSTWNKSTLTYNSTAVCPDGTSSARNYSTNGAYSYVQPLLPIVTTASTYYTVSVFLKYTSGVGKFHVRLTDQASANYISTTVDLILGTISAISYAGSGANGSATIKQFPDNWFRVTVSGTLTQIATNLQITNASLGATTFSIWGGQMELGAYSTSYIPTTTAAVTRNQDVSSKIGITDLIGQTEGVMFIESAALFNDLTSRYISISDGTSNNRILLFYNNVSNVITLASVSNGTVVIGGLSYTISDETQFAKIAVRYSNTLGYSLWVNGVNRISSALTTLPLLMSRFGFDGSSSGLPFYAKVKQVQLYKTYLSDIEMAQLTTL